MPTATKADLVKSLTELHSVLQDKIDYDIDTTAQVFTDVKGYWKSKRWADLFRAPLRAIESTLDLAVKVDDWWSFTQRVNAELDSAQAAYQVLTLLLMAQDSQELRNKVQCALNGPDYVASIANMLEAADSTYVPPLDPEWRDKYKRVIIDHLSRPEGDDLLAVPRRSTTLDRNNLEFASGASQVKMSITRDFNALITAIQNVQLPPDFPFGKVVSQLESLTEKVRWSRLEPVKASYETYLRDGDKYVKENVQAPLGAVAGRDAVFRMVAMNLDKQLSIEMKVEIVKALKAAGNAALLTSGTYTVQGLAQTIKTAQLGFTAVEVTMKQPKVFTVDAEEEFYMLPQEMVLVLPTELSSVWMIADDTDQYLRYLMGISWTPAPTPLPPQPSPPDKSHPWPFFGHDLQHTRQSKNNGPEKPELRWKYETPSAMSISAPALAADGAIYFGSRDSDLYAIKPDGGLKRRFKAGAALSSPAIAGDGTIYVGSEDNKLYAIGPDGGQKWTFTAGDDVLSPPVVAPDGTIYAGSMDHYLYAVKTGGSLKWRFKAEDRIGSSPAIGHDGTVYVGAYGGKLYAVNPDGGMEWVYKVPNGIVRFPVSTPSVAHDGTIYVVADHNKLFGITPEGSLKWKYDYGGLKGISDPALAADGIVYLVSGDDYLRAIGADGNLKWKSGIAGAVTGGWGPPIVAGDGTIFVGTSGNLYAINPNGSLKWTYQIPISGHPYTSQLAIGDNGTIYITSFHTLYALSDG